MEAAAQSSLQLQSSNQLSSEDEEVGTSLFHQLMAQRRLLNPEEEMKFLLHRLIVIGSLPQQLADKRDLGGHYEKLNQRLQRCYPGDGITGLLLLYPTCLLYVIESSTEVLVSALQNLRDMQAHPHSALIVEPRVLVVSHDLPSRLFLQWSFKVLNLPAKTLQDRSERESTENLVSHALRLLLQLGNHLLKATGGSKTSPECVLDEVPELLIPQDVLAQLLEREELLSPQQYLQAYHSPLNVLMDSGPGQGSDLAKTCQVETFESLCKQ